MKFWILFAIFFAQVSFAQTDRVTTVADVQKAINDTLKSKWYERLQIRGYAQFRYNRLFETNKDLKCDQCDKSIGDKQGFFLRRGRIIFYGDVNDRVFIYIQPDYGSSGTSGGNTQQNYFNIRDAYFDYHLTESKEWRIRFGSSKIPYGFENLQSSMNRATPDRNDALNSAVPNERDMGMFLMYAPSEIRERFKALANASLKGSGDYGMVAIGAYNGQTLNRTEKNNDLHRVARLTYPFKLKNGQFIEASIQAYEGKFNTDEQGLDKDFYEQRSAATLVFYPQPIGFQVEWNIGQGPEFDRASNTIKSKQLEGGYAQVYYNLEHNNQRFFPYVKYQRFEGGKKVANNAEFTKMNEWEIGTEWQPHAAFELLVGYAISDRLTQSSNDPSESGFRSHQKGNLLRLQAQFNY